MMKSIRNKMFIDILMWLMIRELFLVLIVVIVRIGDNMMRRIILEGMILLRVLLGLGGFEEWF